MHRVVIARKIGILCLFQIIEVVLKNYNIQESGQGFSINAEGVVMVQKKCFECNSGDILDHNQKWYGNQNVYDHLLDRRGL